MSTPEFGGLAVEGPDTIGVVFYQPPPPEVSSIREYGDRLGDVAFWAPYVRTVLARHDLPGDGIETGFVGTYPTFLIGGVVVKLFGYFHSWRSDHGTELAALHLLQDRSDVPAPVLLTHGRLYDEPDPWPYLVTGRVPGHALRDVSLPAREWLTLAAQLGAAIRRVHDLPVPATNRLRGRDWLGDHGEGCAERHRRWGSLPTHLVDQIHSYLAPPSPVRRLVHADLTAEHIFVEGGRLVGIIDWGDAMVTDPYYELGALHLGAFQVDRRALQAFLAGYGWPARTDFPTRAMSAALRHQFDLFAELPDRFRLDQFDTLPGLAAALWLPCH